MLSFKYIPDAIFIRIVLGTGRLTIARAIGRIFFLDEVWEVELRRKFSEKKNERVLSGLEPMLISLMGQCNYH